MDAMRPQIEAKKLALNALNKDWELSRTEATNIFNQMSQNRRTFYEQERLDARAQLHADTSITTAKMSAQTQRDVAGMPGQLERLYSRLGNGDIAEGLRRYGEIMGPEARGIPALLQKYADPIKLKTLEATDPELAKFVRAQLASRLIHPTDKPIGPVRP